MQSIESWMCLAVTDLYILLLVRIVIGAGSTHSVLKYSLPSGVTHLSQLSGGFSLRELTQMSQIFEAEREGLRFKVHEYR